MIQRKPLRDDVQREILERIADRRLPPGSRINESHLSAEIGVSRTPLREAMLGLEAAGFLASDMGRGFLVPAFSADEFRSIQQVLGRLSPLALALTPPIAPARIMELNNLLGRARMQAASPGPEREANLGGLALRWSGLVLGTCPNRVLTGDVARLETLCVRYWRRIFTGDLDAGPLVTSYEHLYDLLRSGRRDEAGRFWSEHCERFASLAAERLTGAAARA